jgi:tetratricopeptide (TPR) repeat protein
MPYLQQPELGTAVRYARSDHSIAIPRPAFDSTLGIVGSCRGCHADRSARSLEEQVRAWYGAPKPHPRAVAAAFRASGAGKMGIRDAARLVLVADEAHPAALFAGLAWFVEQHLEPDMALDREVAIRLQGLARHRDADVRALSLAALHYAAGNDPRRRALLAAALEELGEDEPLVRPRWALVLGFLGDRLRAQGKALAAITTYRKAREIDPANPRIPVNLALAYVDAGNAPAAVEAYQQSLALDPAQPLTLVNLGIALAGTDPARAMATYRRALALNSREPLAHFNLAGVFTARQQYDSALVHFRLAAELDPSLSLARFYAARIHLERRDFASALREIQAGLEFDRENAEARAMRDRLRREIGR